MAYLAHSRLTGASGLRHDASRQPCAVLARAPRPAVPVQRLAQPASPLPQCIQAVATALGRSIVRRQTSLRAHAVDVYPAPKAERLVLDCAGQQIILETGEIGRQANGAIWARMGDTVLYTTACASPKPTGDGSFVPLQVNYQERYSAIGRTAGGYLKREGRPRDDDVLIARLVDRPLRPMFEKGWSAETQVVQTVFSYDGTHEPEPLAITAAAAALMVSDIPLKKAVAGVRVGWLPEGGLVINPSAQQMAGSRLDLVMAGTADAVLMIEGFCDFLTEEEMLQAVQAGSQAISSMCSQLEAWAAQVGRPKRQDRVLPPQGLAEWARDQAAQQLETALRAARNRAERGAAIAAVEASIVEQLEGGEGAARFPGVAPAQIAMVAKSVSAEVVRRLILTEGLRPDGRGPGDIRPITSRAGLLPRTHGSVLFTRGETQALCVATLGSDSDVQRVDGIRAGDMGERFYLQYFFPPSSVGETGRIGPAGRRELGHGELAQRALAPVVPPAAEWPYTVRVESNITESNGSSSMASVCGGCLAMLDAGVPLKAPVAGIAMGLILEADGSFTVLSDIMGTEDALGDMDFKVAGTAEGVTAFQMDIKVEGITLNIMARALQQAKEGRRHILAAMEGCYPPPRRGVSPYAPQILTMRINGDAIGGIIGPGGKILREILSSTGASTLDVNESGGVGNITLTGPTLESVTAAQQKVLLISGGAPAGTIVRGARVERVSPFGAFVEVAPGKSGLVHLSEADTGSVRTIEDVMQVNDRVDVMVLPTTQEGKLRLSRRAVLLHDAGEPVDMSALASSTSSSTPGPSGMESSDESDGTVASSRYSTGSSSSSRPGRGSSGQYGGSAGRGGRGGGSGRGGRGDGGRGGGRGGRFQYTADSASQGPAAAAADGGSKRPRLE